MNIRILTERSDTTGLGHYNRCYALQQAFTQLGHNCELITNQYDKHYEKSDCLVIDSYLLERNEYVRLFTQTKIPVVIDDNRRISYPPAVIINPTVGSQLFNYQEQNPRALLLGENFALLRPSFWQPSIKRIRRNVARIFITFGGTSVGTLTKNVEKLVPSIFSKLVTTVIANGTFTESQMYSEMKNADLVISAAGQTLYELAAVGCPTVAITIAENQKTNSCNWHQVGFLDETLSVHDTNLLEKLTRILYKQTYQLRKKKSEIGTQLVDGKGAIRVANWIVEYAHNH